MWNGARRYIWYIGREQLVDPATNLDRKGRRKTLYGHYHYDDAPAVKEIIMQAEIFAATYLQYHDHEAYMDFLLSIQTFMEWFENPTLDETRSFLVEKIGKFALDTPE